MSKPKKEFVLGSGGKTKIYWDYQNLVQDKIDMFAQLKKEICFCENLPMVAMTDKELAEFKNEFGQFDMIIGHFGIKWIR